MILILNCGSQSIKWELFDDSLKSQKQGKREVFDSNNYQKLLEEELKNLDKSEINKIGHRIVFGGTSFSKPVKINEKNLPELEKLNAKAPLHNPFNLLGIKICREIFPGAVNIAVFDHEFFSNLKPKAYTYALPEEIREKYGFRKFGYHGISHEYSAKEGAKIIGRQFNKIKIISCHLGGGSSITAINKGVAVDTSMGYSPLEGVVMMTRPGTIDNEIVLELAKDFGIEKTKEILNSESGLKAICLQKDMLSLLGKIKKGDKKAKLALDMFVYQIRKYVGSYFAILGGCDLLVFTGAIGEGSSKIRRMICQSFNILKNTKVLAVKADEELQIARKIRYV